MQEDILEFRGSPRNSFFIFSTTIRSYYLCIT
nr:MAG TPA: hypothetical protein [Caudoviricetes sp.]